MQSTTLSLRCTSLSLALLVLFQALICTPVYGLSGGPTQPEFQQAAQVGSDDLVDLFSGNFRYSIPLFDIGGYPINLSYTSDHKMEEEASWVGFGWTLNPGAISRQVRGLPDDFRGDKDEVVRYANMKDNVTTGVSPGADIEFFGAFGLSTAFNFSYNNYSGYNFNTDISPSVNIMKLLEGESDKDQKPTEAEVREARSVEKNRNPYKINKANGAQFSLSANINSRSGLEHASWSGGSNIYQGSFSLFRQSPTYTPTADLPWRTQSNSFYIKAGIKGFWPDAIQLSYRGFNVTQSLRTNRISRPAFGYLYLEGASDRDDAIMDYNKEQGGLLNLDARRLPIPYGTPDAFNVTGPGLSGQIEIVRNQTPVLRPARSHSTSVSKGVGTDFAPGNIIHLGYNVNASKLSSTREGWTSKNKNNLLSQATTGNTAGGARETRLAHMQFIGSPRHSLNKEQFDALGGSDPLFANITKRVGATTLSLQNVISAANGLVSGETSLSQEVVRNHVFGRTGDRASATVVDYFTHREAAAARGSRPLQRFRMLEAKDTTPVLAAIDDYATSWLAGNDEDKLHHLGEIRITNAAGQRYAYGLPVYNITKHEVTFNASGVPRDEEDSQQGQKLYGQVDYGSIPGAPTIENEQGKDYYYDEVETGPYPVAHLLTGVYSPDYVDVTNNGPSFDDLGNYVKIGYSPLLSTPSSSPAPTSNIGYRTPAEKNSAVFNEGNLSATGEMGDDKASYSYGSKEVYYVNHMDSKTHRALFYTSERADALPVDPNGNSLDAEGNPLGPALRKLDRIEIFSLADLQRRASEAVPIKTVHFTYATAPEDEISGNLPNAKKIAPKSEIGRGKLTLLSVSFTYANNQRGKQNAYHFTYKTSVTEADGTETKIDYQPFMVDRWGSQVPATANEKLDPVRYPYAIQDEATADEYNSLGNLTKIDLPTGGSIQVNYESDDYAYVQDYRAGRMFAIAGFSRELRHDFPQPPGGVNPEFPESLYEPGGRLGTPNLFMYVDVGEAIPEGAEDDIKRRYFGDVDQLYFSALVNLLPGNPEATAERITGYCGFDPESVTFTKPIDDKAKKFLVIKLNPLDIRNRETNSTSAIHPFSYAALEKMRTQIPELLYDLPAEGSLDPVTLAGILENTGGLLQSYFSWRLGDRHRNARTVVPDASFVRLSDPNFGKFGGGSRVSSIQLRDNWLATADANNQLQESAASMTYEKIYTYKTVDEVTGDIISSGVAANEPLNGKEEMLYVNVGKEPDPQFLAPDRTYYLENPAGLHFFPGPNVGYSEVTMRIKLPDEYRQSKPGRTVHTFYTAKDFPTKVTVSRLDREDITPRPRSLPFLSVYFQRHAMSQGFSIELNDMHGKPKGTFEYGYDGTEAISSTKYRYKTGYGPNSGTAGLDNLVSLVKVAPRQDPDQSPKVRVEEDLLGVDVSIWMETTDDRTSSTGGGIQGNADLSQAFIPLFMAIPYPNINQAWSSMQTAAITKVVQRTGILEEVEVMNNGSSLQTENRRWDALTGTPVLTATENEYGQYIYQNTSLAYWMEGYEGMGPAYDRIGAGYAVAGITEGSLSASGILQQDLAAGDEWMLYHPESTGSTRLHVVINPYGHLVVIDDAGLPFNLAAEESEGYRLRLVRDGRRNLLTNPVENVTALNQEPDAASGLYYATRQGATSEASGILSASAMVYSEDWGNLCEPIGPYEGSDPCSQCNTCEPCPGCPTWKPATCEECPNQPACNDGCVGDDCGGSGSGGSGDCQNKLFSDADLIKQPNYNFSGCATVSITDYWKTQVAQLARDCDACERLFYYYAKLNLLENIGRYARCEPGETGPVITPIDAAAETLIKQCDFIETESLGLFRKESVRLADIAQRQSQYENLTACKQTVNEACQTSPYPLVPIASSLTFESAATLDASDSTVLLSQKVPATCFPWHPESGINPYLDGRRGNWRVETSYIPRQTERKFSAIPSGVEIPLNAENEPINDYSQPLLHQDGILLEYSPFYATSTDAGIPNYYIDVNQVTRYDEHGHELETVDALGIPSAAQYGFNQNLPVAVATNAVLTDIGFDGFEDYAYLPGTGNEKWKRHFGMLGADNQPANFDDRIVNTVSHTGWFAYRATSAEQSLAREFTIYTCERTDVYCPEEGDCKRCITDFRPVSGKQYLLSAWVASNQSLTYGGEPRIGGGERDANNSPTLSVKHRGILIEDVVVDSAYPTGPVVEGWQQIQLSFTIADDQTRVLFELSPPGNMEAGQEFYFDDIRIQPYESEMVSYVYDHSTLRLMAQLDDRGYAVLYEYDDEGNLIRQKRETERGVMTITEQHTNLAPVAAQKK